MANIPGKPQRYCVVCGDLVLEKDPYIALVIDDFLGTDSRIGYCHARDGSDCPTILGSRTTLRGPEVRNPMLWKQIHDTVEE